MPVTRVIFGISKESTCLWSFISSPLSFFLKIQFFVSCHLPSTLRTSFSVFYSVDLLVFFQWKGLLVDIPWFSVTESDFIFPLLLKGTFTGNRILGWHFHSFSILKMLFYWFPHRFDWESLVIQIIVPCVHSGIFNFQQFDSNMFVYGFLCSYFVWNSLRFLIVSIHICLPTGRNFQLFLQIIFSTPSSLGFLLCKC